MYAPLQKVYLMALYMKGVKRGKRGHVLLENRAQLLKDKKICFIGAGAMAEAILQGMINQEVVQPTQMTVTNRENRFRLEQLTKHFGVIGEGNGRKHTAIQEADILILAMKPVNIKDALQDIKHVIRADQLVISVVAGISTELISHLTPQNMPVIRTMPNTSAIVGYSSTGMCAGEHVLDEDMLVARAIFESIGLVFVMEEQHLDALTGLSGSGPAYFYYLVESLIKGGEDVGLSHDDAKQLTYQTILGAAHMLNGSEVEPEQLREKITSPNGTTQIGIETLQAYHFEEAVRTCIQNATKRSKELGESMASQIKS